ncbi:hypothetical protein [Mobilicoccus pelagius]|uniref:Uncharacterized protein n=1 Tax=Mobilicoccus pelagius NBRC 104925 TaxID=1089455 RepID=H5USV0_9MICO|nr:hypothetical protein [Mobilicoccus pelagius]GAB48808.1 hypothetical protein MOPEL_083_00130 [Mobilicoccus pelagius NBRC 104925]
MFERKKKKIEVPTIETRTVTVPTAQGLKSMITPAVTAAKEYTQEAAHQAGEYIDQVKPYIEQGRELAEKQAEQAKKQAEQAKKQVENHDGLTEFLASGAAAREIASQRTRDAALVLKGEAKAEPVKKGGFAKVVVNLGVLTVVGALAAVVAQKLRQPKDDPWARPLTDPYVAPAAGRDSSTAGGTGVKVTDVKATGTPATGVKVDDAPAGDKEIRQVSDVDAAPGEAEITPVEGQVPTTDHKN